MSIYDEMLKVNKLLFAKVSTVTLHSLVDGIISGSGSGSIIKYKKTNVLITVSHNVLDKNGTFINPMGIQVGVAQDFKRMEYYIPTYEWLGQITIDEKMIQTIPDFKSYMEEKSEIIDFAYSIIPDSVKPRDEYIDYEKQQVHFYDKNIIETELNTMPKTEDNFFFYGRTRTVLHKEIKKFSFTEQYVENIKYITTMPNKMFYMFQLPDVIIDERDYKGCSGTPIFNQNGMIVSLVAKGLVGTNRILGVNLEKYKLGIEASLIIK